MRKESFLELVEHIKACGFECDFFGPGQIGGYRCEQDPEELADLIKLLREYEVTHNYIEIGSASGGTMRHMQEQIGFDKILSIDHGQWQAEHFPKNIEAFKDKVERHVLDSHSEEALSVFKTFTEKYPGPTILFIDGDHSFDGVIKDISFYATQIQPGDTLIFHDVFCDKVPGVAQAVLYFLCHIKSVQASVKNITTFRNDKAKNKLGILCLEF
jgi:cephalosporin hydroxylase